MRQGDIWGGNLYMEMIPPFYLQNFEMIPSKVEIILTWRDKLYMKIINREITCVRKCIYRK